VGGYLLIPPRRQAEAWRHKWEARSEDSKASEAPHPCTAPFRSRAPDRRAAGPLRAHAPRLPPGTACRHHASCPFLPWAPHVPPASLTSSASSRAHAHLSSPRAPAREGAERVSLARSRGEEWGAGVPEFPFSPSRIKMRVLKLSWFLFYFFPFSSILACLLRKGIFKKKKKKKDKNVLKKQATPTPVSVYIAFQTVSSCCVQSFDRCGEKGECCIEGGLSCAFQIKM